MQALPVTLLASAHYVRGQRCAGTSRDGAPCRDAEVLEGIGYCFRHLPDDAIDEAEELTGWRRCTRPMADGSRCRNVALAGSRPPWCKKHGAARGSIAARAAAVNRIEQGMAAELARLLSGRD